SSRVMTGPMAERIATTSTGGYHRGRKRGGGAPAGGAALTDGGSAEKMGEETDSSAGGGDSRLITTKATDLPFIAAIPSLGSLSAPYGLTHPARAALASTRTSRVGKDRHRRTVVTPNRDRRGIGGASGGRVPAGWEHSRWNPAPLSRPR